MRTHTHTHTEAPAHMSILTIYKACFTQFKTGSRDLRRTKTAVSSLVVVSYIALNILCSQCLSRTFLKEVSVPANAMLDDKINILLITLLGKKVCILISKIFLYSLKGCPLVPVNFSLKLNKEQTV